MPYVSLKTGFVNNIAGQIGKEEVNVKRPFINNIIHHTSIRSNSILKLGSQMSKLRQVEIQMMVYLSTLSLGIIYLVNVQCKSARCMVTLG